VSSNFIKLIPILISISPLISYGSNFPEPPKSNIYSVTQSTTSLGINLQIKKFETNLSAAEILKFYRDVWKDEYSETEMPPWRMIGIRQSNEYWNVQIQDKIGTGSWGYLSKSDLPELLDKKTFKLPSGKGFPMMSGSIVLDDQVSKDPGRDGRVLLIKNNFTPKTNHNYYRNYFTRKGWEIVMDQEVQARESGFAIYARKGSNTITLTIGKLDGSTSIVANEVKRGLLR
tara:strand:- start:19940 stop:20629 length:690 start_codon:yes stop_codon:yes gene_type:complete